MKTLDELKDFEVAKDSLYSIKGGPDPPGGGDGDSDEEDPE